MNSKTRIAAGLIAVLFSLALLAGVARAASVASGMSKAEHRALLVRSDALNRKYQLGRYSRIPAGMTAAEYRAARLRGEALNRTYLVREPAVVAIGNDGFEWSSFGIGAAAMAGFVLLAGAAIAGRRVPMARTSS
jgi:hypothetical protein